MMNVMRLIGAVMVLAVLHRGPAGAAGRTLDSPAAEGPEPGASVPRPSTVEVQTTPLSQAAAPAPSKTLYRVSTGKMPTIAPPQTTTTYFVDRTVKQVPAGSSPMTVGDLQTQFTGAKRPQVFGGRSKDFSAQANGVGGVPYADSRFTADYVTLGHSRVGRLFMFYAGRRFSCTASVINRALLVTAAHCLCQPDFSQSCFPDTDADGNIQVYFDLGRDVTSGQGDSTTWWSAAGVLVPRAYADGTDTSVIPWIVTSNDVALVWLKPKDGIEVGDVGGWNSYAVNGWGFAAPSTAMNLGAPTAPATALITNLAYPGAFDRANRMQISHSAAYFMQLGGVKRNPRGVKGLVRGTSFTPGSSGSAWVANYGIDAEIISNDSGPLGQYGPFNAQRNVVLGVLSWGYTDPARPEAEQLAGASMFGTNKEFPASTYGSRGPGNIGALMYDACDNPALPEWQLKSKGLCE